VVKKEKEGRREEGRREEGRRGTVATKTNKTRLFPSSTQPRMEKKKKEPFWKWITKTTTTL